MARIRTIKPEFWTDEEVGELSPSARLLFIASWNIADDEGLLKWTPAFLKAQVFPYDDLLKEQVQGFMDELTGAGLVFAYKDASCKQYGWIVNFRKHQKIDKPQPARHPLPSLQNPEVRRVYAARDGWCCHICGGSIDPTTNANKRVLSLDHLHPKANGGLDAPSNIRSAHFGCNSGKGARAFDEHSENDSEPSPQEGIKEQGKEGKESRAPNGAAAYAFEGKIIRLTRTDFDRWRAAYSSVDLISELTARDDWLSRQPSDACEKWFVSTSAWLARRNGEASKPKKPPPAWSTL